VDAKPEGLLRLGDTALVLSQRLGAWCGKGPALEEDMALANVALDLLGQARLWLTYAGEVEGRGRDEDALAYHRDSRDFRNLLLVEQGNGSYATTLVRQFYFDAWHRLALGRLQQSADARIADIAAKAVKEVAYHLHRSSDLIVRLGDGTEKSHALVQDAADALWMFTGEMFASDAIDQALARDKISFDPAELKEPWLACVRNVFEQGTLRVPPAEAHMQEGGKQGRHTEQLGYLLAEMQVLQRTHPGAQW
jgi:ring-1,2-phenylacetyl-CoA epoxidase subunit PaaC